MEKRLSEKIEQLEEKIGAHRSENLGEVNERLQQSIRQERRNQAALESVFENQKTELAILRGMRDESKASNAVMAFAEAFALWRQSRPDSPELQVLWAKLAALLGQFGLEILAETGVPFDPFFHEACAVRFAPDEPEGHVLEVVRPGFSSGRDVLRCASVVVNRPAVTAEAGAEDGTRAESENENEMKAEAE
ncbi:MAG: nucleotide exchange factor GrpE [Synergistaceae bacterium]|jgi:molecular chaperone GrpE (heat shock protein)|nr:nucleotide exchange factor GrpE [Synergistaceae bacterium]